MYTTIPFNESCNAPTRFSQQKMETSSDNCGPFENFTFPKTRLHTQATFVALKLHQVSNMFETPAISQRQITLEIAPGLQV